MAPKKKEYVDTVLPVSGDGVDYEVISRKITENAQKQWPDVKADPYDEIVEVRKLATVILKKYLKHTKQ